MSGYEVKQIVKLIIIDSSPSVAVTGKSIQRVASHGRQATINMDLKSHLIFAFHSSPDGKKIITPVQLDAFLFPFERRVMQDLTARLPSPYTNELPN